MARSLTTAVVNELATDSLQPISLIYINIATGLRVTDHYKDVTYDSNTYTASSLFTKLSSVTESSEIQVSNITLTFTGADQTITSLFLNNNYLEKEAEIYKGFINSSEAVIADPFLLFKGRIESFSINESLNKSSVNVSIASHWADFSKVEGRKTNTGTQQIHFPDDLGFEFASQTVQDIKWGRS
tara:strand:- start:512 stop:1066 length:555 start_codon:yes stop_codon:yes gene_type:complete